MVLYAEKYGRLDVSQSDAMYTEKPKMKGFLTSRAGGTFKHKKKQSTAKTQQKHAPRKAFFVSGLYNAHFHNTLGKIKTCFNTNVSFP